MWPRFYKEDFQIVAHYLGMLTIFIGGLMLFPLLVALLTKELDTACDFFLSASVALVCGMALRLAKTDVKGINRRQALMVTSLIWLVAPLVSACPLYLSGHFNCFLDAFFDAVSGFTDTGVALVTDLNHMSYAHNFWRHELQIIGGVGIVVIMLSLANFAKLSGAGLLYKAEGRNDMIMHQLGSTVRFIAGISFVFVTLGIIGSTIPMMVTGMSFASSLFHATCLTFAGFATGGFAPMTNSMVYYHNYPLEMVTMVVMLTGMFSFAMYYLVFTIGVKEFLKDIEVKTIVVWLIICVIIAAVSFARDPYLSQLEAVIRRGVYVVVSAATNTGFSTMYTSQLIFIASKGMLFAVILAMGMGGATNSTTGGIKAYRIAAVFIALVAQVKESLMPERAVFKPSYQHLGKRFLTAQDTKDAMTIFWLFVAMYLFGAMVGVAVGYEPIEAVFESVSVGSNAGLTAGITSPAMPALLKVVYIIQMLVGRLEFLTIFATIVALWVSAKYSVEKHLLVSKNAN